MSLESADFIPGLVATNPEGTDPKSQGDDHLRLLKHVLKTQFPNFTGEAVTKTEAQLNAGLIAGSFGLGATPGASGVYVTDCNAISASGFYNLTPPYSNGPTATAYAILHITYDNNKAQMALNIADTNGDIYVRTFATTWGPWERLWSYSELVPQENAVDPTLGRNMTVGSFGLGVAPVNAFGPNFDNYLTNGFYVLSGALVNAPTGNSDFSLLVGGGGSIPFQITINYANGETFVRSRAASSWTPWLSLAGTVVQSWQDLTASRAFGGTYTNTTTQPIQIKAAAAQTGPNSSTSLTLTVNGMTIDRVQMNGNGSFGEVATVGATIPPGASYVVGITGASSTLAFWCELRQ